jgi:hypothetical protein
MSSKNNVNKDFYTIAGRDRPNEDLVVTRQPRDVERGRRGAPRRNFIPGAAPVGKSPDRAAPEASASKTGLRSGSQKQATARRGGTAPGKARPKAGAFGDTRRGTATTKTAKRGTTRAAATTKRRTASARRSGRRRAA